MNNKKNNLLIVVFLSFIAFDSFALNIQQFSRSNSLTYEMIEDARLANSHVINNYKWLLNLGFSHVDEPLTIKNPNNSQQFDSVINSVSSIHFGGALYLKPYWQIALNGSFSRFDNNFGETIDDFQDLDFKTKIRLFSGRRSAFTIMPTVSLALNGGETRLADNSNPRNVFGVDEVLSNRGTGVGLFAIYEYLFRHFQVAFNIGYTINSDAKFIDIRGVTQIDKTEVLTTGFGLYYPFHKKIGLNVEFLSNLTAPFFNDDINPTELFIGLSSGVVENVHSFIGAGFGNVFSGKDGNDYRIVAGLKFTPGTQKKDLTTNQYKKQKPSRIIEDFKGDICKFAYLFEKSNGLTFLFDNNSHELSKVQLEKLSQIIKIYNQRSADVKAIEIYGHTSTRGTHNYNTKLGLRRARNVKSALVRSGINESLFSIIESRGETLLLEDESNKEKIKYNRRTEVSFVLSDRFQKCYES